MFRLVRFFVAVVATLAWSSPSASAQDEPPSKVTVTVADETTEATHAEQSKAAEAAILEALKKPITLQADEAPLEEVLRQIEAKSGAELELKRGSVTKSSVVTIDVQNVSARAALEQVLEQHNLSWRIKHQVVWISRESNGDALYYQLHDLSGMRLGVGYKNGVPTFDSLRGNLVRVQRTDAAKSAEGCLNVIRLLGDQPAWAATSEKGVALLTTRQSRESHELIDSLFAEARRRAATPSSDELGSPDANGPETTDHAAPLHLEAEDTSAEAAIRRALDIPISMTAEQAPLGQVLDAIAKTAGGDIRFEVSRRVRLHEVSFEVRDLSARAVMELALDQHGLTWRAEHGAIVVYPSNETGVKHEYYRTHDVTDLVLVLGEGLPGLDGTDRMSPVLFTGDGTPLLFARQRREVHERLQSLLAEARRRDETRPAPGPVKPEQANAEEVASRRRAAGAGSRIPNGPPTTESTTARPKVA